MTALCFVTFILVLECAIVLASVPAIEEATVIQLPLINVSLSPFFHLLPAAVLVALTASFTYLTVNTTIRPREQPRVRRPLERGGRRRLRARPLRQFYNRLRGGFRRIGHRLGRISVVSFIRHRVVLARSTIKSGATVALTFAALILLVTVAGYPRLVSQATKDLLQWKPLLGFITVTIGASEAIAKAVPPLGIVATAIVNGLNAAAPAFHSTLEGAASQLTEGLVGLTPVDKYLITQNASAWTVVLASLIYGYYMKTRRYRR